MKIEVKGGVLTVEGCEPVSLKQEVLRCLECGELVEAEDACGEGHEGPFVAYSYRRTEAMGGKVLHTKNKPEKKSAAVVRAIDRIQESLEDRSNQAPGDLTVYGLDESDAKALLRFLGRKVRR
jgi:RecJ-like exonuclease